ncbi:uncharacterized protein EKO05_0003649 [Ascochyta rabiei]|uniref:uncharacterized protein n=1 Tax=Didymella rabiei TaxID=5454 RepID=UPI00190273F6|nr:uncharacterized protein EKO05_0003649 [Ascochyta rabiei]UPX13123.1 hypothetical protein EKO05_0003649 [Ascochyta rabiei]
MLTIVEDLSGEQELFPMLEAPTWRNNAAPAIGSTLPLHSSFLIHQLLLIRFIVLLGWQMFLMIYFNCQVVRSTPCYAAVARIGPFITSQRFTSGATKKEHPKAFTLSNVVKMSTSTLYRSETLGWLATQPWKTSRTTSKDDSAAENVSPHDSAPKTTVSDTKQEIARSEEVVTVWPHLW